MTSTRYEGNSRYKATRTCEYDMQRSFSGGRFDDIPFERADVMGGAKKAMKSKKDDDPLLKQLSIEDTTDEEFVKKGFKNGKG